ncbi:germin-like protein 8-2 [Juglans regia]|uniref:Germin-like protein 8-2 n=1 Tax=Juglans regia TaxID=51240 RepID=A0A2I4HU16_JUGRE|nr:germin-like protein 8-2 [Juglans regia]
MRQLPVFVNGKFCKDPELVTANDFFHSLNVGNTKAVAFAGLSSHNPRVITIANAVFGSNPPINQDVLTKAFQVDKNVVNYLQKQF